MNISTIVAETDGDVAIVVLSIEINGKKSTVTGSARRDPVDKPDPQLGLKLAYQRALEKLTSKIARQTLGKIKHNDDMREYKEVQKNRRKSSRERHPSGQKFKVGDRVKITNVTNWIPDLQVLLGGSGVISNLDGIRTNTYATVDLDPRYRNLCNNGKCVNANIKSFTLLKD